MASLPARPAALLFFALAFAAVAVGCVAAALPAVPLWQPHDFTFTAETQPANRFTVPFSATLTGPDGKTFTLLGSLEIADAPAPLRAQWFNSFTGKSTAAGSFDNGTARLTPPAAWGDAPVVLHLKSK